MFQDLYKLFYTHRNSPKTPLEDFNTESFANILRLYPKVTDAFTKELLDSVNEITKIKTQVSYTLKEDINCIIDLVLENEHAIYFIENKVGSKESYEQLNRYAKALEAYYPYKEKHLIYCTRDADPKNEEGQYKNYNFKQWRWFEIAKFLKNYNTENHLIKEYLNFLKQHKMAQDQTIRVENLLALEHMQKTVEMVTHYIQNSKSDFEQRFGSANHDHNSFYHKQLREHSRFCNVSYNPLLCMNGRKSEILYSIEFESSKLNTQIWVQANHIQTDVFKDVANKAQGLKLNTYDHGLLLTRQEDLGKYLNDENASINIKTWFLNSFKLFSSFILTNNMNLTWQEDLVEKLQIVIKKQKERHSELDSESPHLE